MVETFCDVKGVAEDVMVTDSVAPVLGKLDGFASMVEEGLRLVVLVALISG